MRFATLPLIALAAFAQNTGSISGKVADHDGVALPKAAIEATNTATKAVFKGTSAANGAYTLSGLPAGKYAVSAMVIGLLPFEKKDVAVTAGQTTRLDIRLEDFANLNTLGDGRELLVSLMTSHKTPAGATPRASNGKPDLTGVWFPALGNATGAPDLLPAAQAVVKQRVENNLKDFPMSRCLPIGLTNFGMFLPFRVVQTPNYLAMLAESDGFWQVYLDGRAHPKNAEPTWMGHSVGRWEGDALVVDTVGFNGQAWLDLEGHPSSPRMHITTRITRPDLGHLDVKFTVEDPTYYAKPWTIARVNDLAPGEEVGEYICTENNKDLQHMVGK